MSFITPEGSVFDEKLIKIIEEITHWIRELAALLEAPGSLPNTHRVPQFQRDPVFSSVLLKN